MKAAVFHNKHNLRIEEIEKPHPKDKEVLIKIKACGICGTDIHIFEGDEGAAATPCGTVLGHEFSGVVEAVGKNVKSVTVGDRVCVDPNKLCNECYYCKNGIGHFCENMDGIGTTINGGFAEYCAVPESQIYKFSENISFEAAAMCEPLACCLHGIDMCDIVTGDNVVIIGGGMIGLIMLQLAKIKGAAKIVMIEPIAEKRKIAKNLGADITIDPVCEDVNTVLNYNGINRVTTVIECVGKTETMKNAISYAGKKSTVMLFGLTKPNEIVDIKPFELFKKEIVLKTSFINPYTQKRALDLIESRKIDVESMIFATETLDKLPYILNESTQCMAGKYIIHP